MFVLFLFQHNNASEHKASSIKNAFLSLVWENLNWNIDSLVLLFPSGSKSCSQVPTSGGKTGARRGEAVMFGCPHTLFVVRECLDFMSVFYLDINFRAATNN